MIKPIHSILFFLSIAPLMDISAQITILPEDMPVAGDDIIQFVDTVPTNGPGSSGPMQTWDFSMAQNQGVIATSVIAAAGSPYESSFPGSDLALVSDGAYQYYTISPGSLVTNGFAADFFGSGEPMAVTFNSGLTVHEFPRTFGTAFTDTYDFEFELDGTEFEVDAVRVKHNSVVSDTTDGYGTIITPVGSYNSLRSRSTDIFVDSVWVRLLPNAPWIFVQEVVGTNVGYAWHAKETKLPVAEMSVDSLGNPLTFTYSSIEPEINTTVTALHSASTVSVFPVPCTDGFQLRLSEPGRHAFARLHAADGRMVGQIALGTSDTYHITTVDLPTGVYLMQLVPVQGGSAEVVRVVVE